MPSNCAVEIQFNILNMEQTVYANPIIHSLTHARPVLCSFVHDARQSSEPDLNRTFTRPISVCSVPRRFAAATS